MTAKNFQLRHIGGSSRAKFFDAKHTPKCSQSDSSRDWTRPQFWRKPASKQCQENVKGLSGFNVARIDRTQLAAESIHEANAGLLRIEFCRQRIPKIGGLIIPQEDLSHGSTGQQLSGFDENPSGSVDMLLLGKR